MREAYKLTFPSKEEQERLRSKPAGAPPTPPTSDDRARDAVRRRVLEIASQESAFVEELVKLGAQKLGKYEEQLRYAELAHQAAEGGALEAAADYIQKATKADPTQITFAFVVNKIALTDRAAADRLIIQYIDFLRSFPISSQNQSDMRTMFILQELLFPRSTSQQRISPPGAAAMRSYVSYVLERASIMEQADLQNSRLWLLSIWGILRQYAPEMTDTFLALEARSRRPGETAQLPEKSLQDDYRKRSEAQLKEALDSDEPDEHAIFTTLSRKEFEKARKLIEKLKDKNRKAEFTEIVNLREASSLAAKGDLTGAESLAQKLTKASSILEVYPLLIEKCVSKKDQACASITTAQGLKQLKQADTTLLSPPEGVPLSIMPMSREFDPILLSLSKFAKAIAPINDTQAIEILNEMVDVANHSDTDTGQG